MDFGVETVPQISYVNNKKKLFTSSSNSKEKSIEMEVLYSYIGISVFNNEKLICQGVNEAGLHVSTLWFPDAEYSEYDDKSVTKQIEISEISDFILSCFSNTEELKKNLNNVFVWSKNHQELNGVVPVHFSIIDKDGNEIILECINQKLKIYDNYFGVFTNAPSFDWHTTNLRNFIKLDTKSTLSKEFNDLVLKQNGFGNGLLGIPGDYTSPSRFTRIFYLKNYMQKPKNISEALAFFATLIGSVNILPGLENPDPGYTQWHIMLVNNDKMYIKFFDNLNYSEINLKEIFNKKK